MKFYMPKLPLLRSTVLFCKVCEQALRIRTVHF